MPEVTYEEAKQAKETLIKYLEDKIGEDFGSYRDNPREATALLALEEIL